MTHWQSMDWHGMALALQLCVELRTLSFRDSGMGDVGAEVPSSATLCLAPAPKSTANSTHGLIFWKGDVGPRV
eukprot:3077582-Rhodomonas_salina.2